MVLRRYVTRLRGDPGSLRARSIESTLWTVAGIGAQRSLSLVSNLMMTQLLLPEAFGLMAIVTTVHTMVTMMSDIGIHQSIVRSPRGGELYFLRVAWSVQIVRSLVIAAGVLVAALAIFLLGPSLGAPGSVYADKALPALVAVSTLTIVFRGFESTAMASALRQLRLRKVTLIETGNQIITLTLMFGLAHIHASVWVLLMGMLIGSFQKLIWTHVGFRNLPMRWTWDKDIASEMWQYGRWLIGSSMAGFIVNQGDKFLMGALLDKTMFGYYVIAMIWVQTAEMFVGQFNSQIIMPVASETLRTDRTKIGFVLGKVRRGIDALIVAGFVGVIVLGPVLILTLYPADYATAAVMIGFLSFRFLARRTLPLGALLLAEGDSRAMALSTVVAALGMVTVVPLVFHTFGLSGALLAIALMPLAGVPILLRHASRRFPELPVRSDIWYLLVTLALAGAALSFGLPFQP